MFHTLQTPLSSLKPAQGLCISFFFFDTSKANDDDEEDEDDDDDDDEEVEMDFVDCGGRLVKKKRKTKKKDRVERLMERAEQGREKRWRRRANCKGRAEMRDEGVRELMGISLIIKVVGARRKNPNRCGYVSEAINLQGDLIFSGGASCAADSVLAAVQEATMEASIKATTLGYRQILVLSDCKRLVQVSNGKNSPNWKEKIMLTDSHSLSQNGLVFQSFLYQGSFCVKLLL
uniref:Uncharacterized protein n=1 Tax=Quercus lobata TaxID=97700 RepID=A0A7N2QXU8_QUELO